MNDVIVIGGGGHAKVVLDAIASAGRLRAVGVIVGQGSSPDPGITLPVVATDDQLADALKGHAQVVVAIGDNHTRSEMVRKIQSARPGVVFATVAHPSAVISPFAQIGAGTVIMPGAVVNAGCTVGAHCILNTRASLDHDCAMGDYSALAPGATVGGRCAIGTGAWVGLGASVIHGRVIGEHAVIGAGAVVVDDIPGCVVAVGVPARVIRKRKADEKYL